jgi:hypothetical protein
MMISRSGSGAYIYCRLNDDHYRVYLAVATTEGVVLWLQCDFGGVIIAILLDGVWYIWHNLASSGVYKVQPHQFV